MKQTTTPESLADTVARANDIEYWRHLAKNVAEVHPCLRGFRHGTLWVDGTPAPILAYALRGAEPLNVVFSNYVEK